MKYLVIPRSQWLLGLTASIVAGALAGFLVDVGGDLVPKSGMFLYPMSVIYGVLAGQVVIKAYECSPNGSLRTITIAALIAGAVGGRLLVGMLVLAASPLPHAWVRYTSALLANIISPALVFSLLAIALGMTVRMRLADRRV